MTILKFLRSRKQIALLDLRKSINECIDSGLTAMDIIDEFDVVLDAHAHSLGKVS